MFNSFKERINTTVKQLAENERLQQANNAMANGIARARTRVQQQQQQRQQQQLEREQRLRVPSVESAEQLLREVEAIADDNQYPIDDDSSIIHDDSLSHPSITITSNKDDSIDDDSADLLVSSVNDIATNNQKDQTDSDVSSRNQQLNDDNMNIASLNVERASSIRDHPLSPSSVTSVSELPRDIRVKLEKLQKYEARFPDIAKTYKLLLREKKAIESVLREVTPLDGIGDVSAFEEHLRSLDERSNMARQEIQRLTELEQLRTDELKTLQAQLDAERAANDAKREKLERQLMPATGLDSSLLERASIYSKEDSVYGTHSLGQILKELDSFLRDQPRNGTDLEALLEDTPTAKKALSSLQSHLGEIAPLGGVVTMANSKSAKSPLGKSMESAKEFEKANRLEKENKDLRAKLKKQDAVIISQRSLPSKIEMLEKELAAARKLISTNNDEVELLKKQNNELTGQTMHLKEQTTKLESTASRCEQLSVQAEEHQNQLKELLSQLNDVKQTNTEQTDAVQKQLTEAYQNIQQLTADVDYNSDNEIKVNDITIDSLSLAQLANLLVEQIQQAQQHIQTSLVIPLKEKTTELDNKQCELKELKEQSALLASSPSSSNETEMAALASKVEALSQELDEIKGEKATLETAMTKLEQEKTDETAVLKATIADLEKRTDGQDGSASTGGGKAAKKARRELNEVKRKLEASEKTLASIKTEHETALDGTKNRIEELEAQVNVAIKERDEARSRVDQLMEEKESVAKKAIEIADIVTLNNKTIEELSQTLARFEETLEKKEKELDDANNQLASLKQISHDLTDKLKVSDQELTEQRETNNKVVKEREKLQEAATQALISLEDTKKEVTIAQTRIEELSTELETSVSLGRERDIEMAKLKGSAKEHEDNVIKLTEMLKACRQQIEKLRQERDGHVKTIEERSANAARLEELVERAAQQSKADVAERDKLKAAVEDLTNTCDKLEEKKTQLVDSLQMKQAECESLESALKQLQSRLDAAEQQQQRQIDRVKILEEELSTSRRLFSQKSSECDEVKTKMAELESVYRTTETRLERELKRREERAVSLAKEMDGIRSEKDSIQQTMKQQLQKIIKERDEITVQLSNVKEELSRVQAEQIATLDKLTTVTNDMAIAKQQEESISLQLSQERARIASIEKEKTQLDGQLEESTLRESHLRTLNKTLKDEIRRMQRRLEQQPLEPSLSMPRASPSPVSSLPTSPMKVRSPSEPRGSVDQQLGETVNLEYLRHIVLKFVEFRAQRQQLIPVLGMLLKLTPQELSKIERLQAAEL